VPEVTRDELGRRMFALNKERAVESAVEKIRKNPESDWNSFSESDRELLAYILGEVWVAVDRSTWNQYVFSRLSRTDVRLLVEIGRDVRRKKHLERNAIEDFERIVRISA